MLVKEPPAIYKTKRWLVLRRKQLFNEPLCKCGAIATDADHVQPIGLGGDPWSLTNLQSLCHSCHSRKTWSETQGRPTLPQMLDLVILVGPNGVGKTEIRWRLALLLDYASLGPDDFEDRWKGVIRSLWEADKAIVECCRIPPSLLSSNMKVVHLTASEHSREQRLKERGDTDSQVAERLEEARDERLSFHASVEPGLVVDTDDDDPWMVAREVAGWVRGALPCLT